MAKKLRTEPIYIAPEIFGWIDENYDPKVYDEKNDTELNPNDVNDKIIIYERQVKEWFLEPALNLVKYRNKNKGFIVLMICMSYLEGIEQYRRGESSNRNSRRFFISAVNRLYPNKFQENQLGGLYSEARCGLFHNGMVQGRIIINNSFNESIEFIGDDIKISPSKFLNDIINDFNEYIQELRESQVARDLFNQMYSNI